MVVAAKVIKGIGRGDVVEKCVAVVLTPRASTTCCFKANFPIACAKSLANSSVANGLGFVDAFNNAALISTVKPGISIKIPPIVL